MIFNTEMARAILDGRKTVTRRPVKPQPNGAHMVMDCDEEEHTFDFLCGKMVNGALVDYAETVKAPYWPGDILWVRETWAKDIDGEFVYRTDYGTTEDDSFPPSMFKWRPSIHMPREAARIFLRVTDVNVERLKEIKFRDIRQEGVNWWEEACEKWINVWNSTIKPADLPTYGWEANPWVWVISFEKITKEEAENKRR